MGEMELADIESVNVWPWGAGVRVDTDRDYVQGGTTTQVLRYGVNA